MVMLSDILVDVGVIIMISVGLGGGVLVGLAVFFAGWVFFISFPFNDSNSSALPRHSIIISKICVLIIFLLLSEYDGFG